MNDKRHARIGAVVIGVAAVLRSGGMQSAQTVRETHESTLKGPGVDLSGECGSQATGGSDSDTSQSSRKIISPCQDDASRMISVAALPRSGTHASGPVDHSDEELGMLIDDESDDEDSAAGAGSQEEQESDEEEPIISRTAAAAGRAQPRHAEDAPLATFSSRIFSRSSASLLPTKTFQDKDAQASTPDSSARAAGAAGTKILGKAVARGGGIIGARALGAGGGVEPLPSPGTKPSVCPPGPSAAPASAAAPAPAASVVSAVVPVAPPVKKIPTAPKLRVANFNIEDEERKDGSASDTGGNEGPAKADSSAGVEAEQEMDVWSTEQLSARQAELKFRVGGGGIYNCVKKCLLSNGFHPSTPGEADWNIFWGRPLRFVEFAELDQFQKVNHFPGTYLLGRKDHLARACQRARRLWGSEEMDFLPKTWVLPSDRSELATEVECKEGKQMYIVKPPDGCKGHGIRIYNDPIARTKPAMVCVVSRYLANPLLINGTKFDIRIYVTVTSFQPLRVYVHEQGLVRLVQILKSQLTFPFT